MGCRSAVHRLARLDFENNPRDTWWNLRRLPKVNLTMRRVGFRHQNLCYWSELSAQGQKHGEAKGIWHNSLDYSFRAAPDLFLWDGKPFL